VPAEGPTDLGANRRKGARRKAETRVPERSVRGASWQRSGPRYRYATLPGFERVEALGQLTQGLAGELHGSWAL
jgi:hypothetical protein